MSRIIPIIHLQLKADGNTNGGNQGPGKKNEKSVYMYVLLLKYKIAVITCAGTPRSTLKPAKYNVIMQIPVAKPFRINNRIILEVSRGMLYCLREQSFASTIHFLES
jgi:hypothetical protein